MLSSSRIDEARERACAAGTRAQSLHARSIELRAGRPVDAADLERARQALQTARVLALRAAESLDRARACATAPDAGRGINAVASMTARSESSAARRRAAEIFNHELRTPATKLLIHAELLCQESEAVRPDLRRSVEVIRASAVEIVRCVGEVATAVTSELCLDGRAAGRSIRPGA